MNDRIMARGSCQGSPRQQRNGAPSGQSAVVGTPRRPHSEVELAVPSEPQPQAKPAANRSRVVYVGDDQTMHHQVRVACMADGGLVWAGSCRNVETLLRQLSTARPDIVVLTHTIDVAATESLWRLKGADGSLRVIVVGLLADWHSLSRAMRAGAKGYLLRSRCGQEMTRALTAVARGEAFLCPAAQQSVAQHWEQRGPTTPSGNGLTPCETEVLRLVGEGFTYKGAAEQLGKSVHTVSTHLRHAREKLAAGSTTQAVHKADLAADGSGGI